MERTAKTQRGTQREEKRDKRNEDKKLIHMRSSKEANEVTLKSVTYIQLFTKYQVSPEIHIHEA